MFNTILVLPLFNLLALIYAVLPLHDFGLAIIILTVLVRLALWPLVNKQLHSQRAMQKIAPEVAKIRAQAKGDRQKESQMLMELYKERNISPFASLLPLFIQLPIFIALYVVLRDLVVPGQIAHLAYSSIRHLAPISDLINGSVKFAPTLLGWVNLAKPNWVLAVLAGAAQFVQTKQLTPHNPSADAQTRAMTTTTLFFPLITIVIGITLPAALALYWVVTSLVAVGQQYLVLRRDVAEMEGVRD